MQAQERFWRFTIDISLHNSNRICQQQKFMINAIAFTIFLNLIIE